MADADRKVSFKPWIGSHYSNGGLEGTQLLVLGESHYGSEEETRNNFTEEVVRSHVFEGRHAFFTKIAKLIVGRGAGNYIPQAEREWAWDRIAFYNYIQSLAGESPDGSVTDQMWEDAREPYLDVVEETDPDAILIVGKGLGRHVPTLEGYSAVEGIESLEGVETLNIEHVSAPGFSYDPWMGKVRGLLGDIDPSR